MKFKVGDKVKIARKVMPDSDNYVWLDKMDEFIGSIGKIIHIEHPGEGVNTPLTNRMCLAFDNNNYYWFDEQCLEKVETEEADMVNHPPHYNYGNGMEVIDVIDAFDCNYEQGNIIKYVLRYKHKNGVEDLKKAKWYLEHLIEKELKK